MITLRSSQYTNTEYYCLNLLIRYGYISHFNKYCSKCDRKRTCLALKDAQSFISHLNKKEVNLP